MQFAVIGLGAFGRTVALELQRLGNVVVGIDAAPHLVDLVKDQLSHVVIADVKERVILEELNVVQFDGVLVAIGENLESSLLCVLNLIQLGVKNIWVKAKSQSHHDILEKLGISNIIRTERDEGLRIAQALNYPMVRQYMALGGQQFLLEIVVPDVLVGKPVSALYDFDPSIRVFLIKRSRELIGAIPREFIMEERDRLFFSGTLDTPRKLQAWLTK